MQRVRVEDWQKNCTPLQQHTYSQVQVRLGKVMQHQLCAGAIAKFYVFFKFASNLSSGSRNPLNNFFVGYLNYSPSQNASERLSVYC